MVSTETAVTIFGITAGAAGGLGQILASRRLSAFPDEKISVWKVAIPAGVVVLTAVGVTYLLPTG